MKLKKRIIISKNSNKMKKLSLLFTLIILMFFVVDLKAQTKAGYSAGHLAVLEPKTSSNTQNFIFPEIENYDGTYQFIVKQKSNFLFTTETFQIIENSRQENSDVTITLNEFLDVFIFSKNAIKQSGFVPYKSLYILK